MIAPGAAAPQRSVTRPLASRLADLARADVLLLAGAVVAIAAVAVALRFVGLPSNPGGLYPDEAAEALDAQRLLHLNGLPPVWFSSDGGREALFAYVVAGSFTLLGQTVFALRATAAVLGLAGVFTAGWLAARFGRVAGLVAAAWSAGSLWLVAVDRDGMRNAIVPVACALALIALLRWVDVPTRRRAALAGGVVALASLYTYQPLKLLPLLVVLWLLWLKRSGSPSYQPLRRDLVPAGIAFCVVALPMAMAAIQDPSNYLGRAASVTALNPDVQSDNGIVGHVVRTLGMFTFFGDPNARHNVASTPLLGPPLVAWPMFLLGCLGVMRMWRRRSDPAHALMLLSLPVFLLPPLPAIEGGAPHFLRALGLAVPVAVAIGLGAAELVDRAAAVATRGLAGGAAVMSHASASRGSPPAASEPNGSPQAGPASRGRSPGHLRPARTWPAIAAVSVALVALFSAQAAATATAYFSRPVADRYDAYDYAVVALSEAVRPHDAVIVDAYNEMDVRFLAAAADPAIFNDANALTAPASFHRILSADHRVLVTVQQRLAPQPPIEPIAFGPDGSPTVWAITLPATP